MAKDQVLAILRELEEDPLYTPDSEDYLVAIDNEGSPRVGVISQHVKAWGGWQLVWIVEYRDLHPVSVRIRLRYEATIRAEYLRPNY